jgi:hypothetical protein
MPAKQRKEKEEQLACDSDKCRATLELVPEKSMRRGIHGMGAISLNAPNDRASIAPPRNRHRDLDRCK